MMSTNRELRTDLRTYVSPPQFAVSKYTNDGKVAFGGNFNKNIFTEKF